MRTKEENTKLAEILFPDVREIPSDVESRYPKRESKDGEMILRFAPSPTGFIQLGNIFAGLVCVKLAKQTNGVAILRIEDTDKGREVENGITGIVDGLKGFGIEFDEGMINENEWVGEYGPYIQSKRLEIYRVYAKELISRGCAYPCFLREEDLEKIRNKQLELGERTGCYGKWAKWRDASVEDIQERIESGKKFVIRLYSTGDFEKTFSFKDMVKGGVTLRENDMDAVLLKSDGFPTYHFAHPIDDMLMGITNVIRADEWFASVPLHLELFSKLGFNQIPYAHLSPIMKLDNGNKRKLSKRKDPEAAASYYVENGYPKEGVLAYLLNIANSNFYDWRIENPTVSPWEFNLKIEKFNKAGALFDIQKLDDTCKDYLATLSAEEVYNMALEWSRDFDKEVYELLINNKEYCISILNIERVGEKIRKDIVKFKDVKDQLRIFFDNLLDSPEDISEKISVGIQVNILNKYLEVFSLDVSSSDEWFDVVKDVAKNLNIERVGDVAMVLRVGVTHRTRTPDLYQVMKVLGYEKVRERLENYIDMMV